MAHDIAKQLAALKTHHEAIRAEPVQAMFAADPPAIREIPRSRSTICCSIIRRQRVTGETMTLLFDLAKAAGLEAHRAALFVGETVNPTEHRAAMHMALRNVSGQPMMAQGKDVMPRRHRRARQDGRLRRGDPLWRDQGVGRRQVQPMSSISASAAPTSARQWSRARSPPYVQKGLSLHFVSNVDGADLGDVTEGGAARDDAFHRPAPRTFTTLETMTNAQTARKAVADKLGEKAVVDHFAAVSTQLDKIAEFGISEDRVFGFWDWVGGRYSVWSAIGLSVMIGNRPRQFSRILERRPGHRRAFRLGLRWKRTFRR